MYTLHRPNESYATDSNLDRGLPHEMKLIACTIQFSGVLHKQINLLHTDSWRLSLPVVLLDCKRSSCQTACSDALVSWCQSHEGIECALSPGA